jgi:hypothetical protein
VNKAMLCCKEVVRICAFGAFDPIFGFASAKKRTAIPNGLVRAVREKQVACPPSD